MQQRMSDLCFLECGEGLPVGLLPQSLRVLLQGHVWVRRPAGVGVCRALKRTMSLYEACSATHVPKSTFEGSKNMFVSSRKTFIFVFMYYWCSPAPFTSCSTFTGPKREGCGCASAVKMSRPPWEKCNLHGHKGGPGARMKADSV